MNKKTIIIILLALVATVTLGTGTLSRACPRSRSVLIS